MYGINNVELIKGFAESLPFEDDFFDLIVSNNGLNNVDDPQQAFYECGRVSKPGAQFVITYNLPETMKEFYDIFIGVLTELKLEGEIQKVNEHIFKKRKPIEYTLKQIVSSGFKIQNVIEDSFNYKYSDGTSLLNHYFIKLAFLPCWEELLPDIKIKEVFKMTEDKLNCKAMEMDGISLSVPFACIDAYKI